MTKDLMMTNLYLFLHTTFMELDHLSQLIKENMTFLVKNGATERFLLKLELDKTM